MSMYILLWSYLIILTIIAFALYYRLQKRHKRLLKRIYKEGFMGGLMEFKLPTREDLNDFLDEKYTEFINNKMSINSMKNYPEKYFSKPDSKA